MKKYRLLFRPGLAACTFLAVASSLSAQTLTRRDAADYSGQPYVVERISHNVEFESSGTFSMQAVVRVRIQSTSGIQNWGLVRVPYASSNGDVEFTSVRVHKPNGTVVTTPLQGVQDMPAQITVEAPFYSDIKEKQLAVRGLEVGDVLEYEHIYRVRTPMIPGHFWYAHNFFKAGIILSNELKVRVPGDRYVKVKSPNFEPVVTEAGGYRVYAWKTANLKTNELEENSDGSDTPFAEVQLTSFRSWDEIADWYRPLQESRMELTPALRAKAQELTANLRSENEKVRALYAYVAMKFRYVGIAFGIGRYQPHTAAEVLENGFGDCKDKHTLLAALLAAAGIKSYPALVNASRDIDPDIPSPTQFDHMITAVQQGRDLIWLDTTPEVAPFGLLVENVRDKQVLVVSDARPAPMAKTPADPPFRSSFYFIMNGKMGTDGTLDARADVSVRGDLEVPLRGTFRNTPGPQWKSLVQSLSESWGFAGTVDEVSVSSPETMGDVFSVSYTYTRKNYPRWPDAIGPPLPPVNLAELSDASAKLAKPIRLESPGEYVLDAKVELPGNLTPRLRPMLEIKKDFAEYRAAYSMNANVLHVERRLAIHLREIPKSRSEEYRAFWRTVNDDRDVVLSLISAALVGATPLTASSNASAAEQINLGDVLFYQDDYDGAIEQYRRVLLQEPGNFRAHLNLGKAFYFKENYDDALSEYREALRLRPGDSEAHASMGSALLAKNDVNGAVAEYRESLRLKSDDALTHTNLGGALFRQRNWDEAIAEYQEALRLNPNTVEAQRGLGSTLYNKGDFSAAVRAYRESVRLEPDSSEAHESLGDTLYMARDYEGAVTELREALRLDPKNLYAQRRLGNVLHTQREYDSAIAAYRAALLLDPTDPQARGQLGDTLYAKGDLDGAILEYREAARSNPNNAETGRTSAIRIGNALMGSNRYAQAITELQPAVEKYPQDAGLWFALGRAKLRSGAAQDGHAALARSLGLSPTPTAFNNAAWELAESNVLLDEALRFGEQATSQQSDRTAAIDLRTLSVADARLMGGLAAYWDTLGWVYFRRGQTAEAEKYLAAAWKLSQRFAMGDHLGQVYERAGNTQQAIRHYALALAAPGVNPDAGQVRSRLAALLGNDAGIEEVIGRAREELGQLRTVRLARVTSGPAKAEFFVLFASGAGVTSVRFVSGSEQLRNAADAIAAAKFDVTFPDDRPAKILRRGVLDCPATGASCQFVLLPPESVTSIN